MKTAWCALMLIGSLTIAGLFVPPARGGAVKCKMTFNLEGWSAFYKTAKGRGTITCDNGQSARVSLHTTGGGPTVGISKMANASGTFSEVGDIGELFGTYAVAEAHAGAVESSSAQVLTKGLVSLVLKGSGKGVDLGVNFGKFVIERRGTDAAPRN